jgi:hypothetical protein
MSDNKINVLVGANIGGLVDGLNEAASAIQKGGEKIQDSSEKASKASANAYKTLQQEYRQTYKDSQILAQQQGINSTAFLEAATKAGEYKNQLDDVAEVTKAMSSDTPVLTAALGVGQGLAGAFAAAQGAMALFGSDSKFLQETMLKVQASMALVTGLQALGGLQNALGAMSATITTKVLPALTALKISLFTLEGALIASGIGILLIALGAIISAMGDYNDALTLAAENEKKVGENAKEMQTAVSTAVNANLKTLQMQAEAMKDGVAKDTQLLKVKKEQSIQAEKDIFEASNKTYIDSIRLKERSKAIEEKYQNDLAAIREKYNKRTGDSPAIRAKQEAVVTIDLKVKTLGEISEWYNNELKNKWDKIPPLELKPIDSKDWVKSIKDPYEKVIEWEKTLRTAAASALSGIGQSIGTALAEGKDAGEAGLKAMLSAVGGILIQFGELAIGAGLAAVGIQQALKLMNPVAAIAAGIALVALGAFVSSKAASLGQTSGGGGGGGGGNFSPNANYSSNTGSALSFKPMSTYIEVGGQVRGNNLKISLINTDISNRRVK